MKTFKEYRAGLGGHRIGYIDNIKPMASLGDVPPKGQAGRDSKFMGLAANYTTQGVGTIKPMITADAKSIQMKNWKSKGMGPYKFKKEEVIHEFSDSMLDKLEREYKGLKGKTISIAQANKLRDIMKKIPNNALDALRRRRIPFLSGLALSRMIKLGMPVKEELQEMSSTQKNNIMKKARELGVDVTLTKGGINLNSFRSQRNMDKFMKYIASMGKNLISINPDGSMNEDEDHEISMARGELEAISDKALELSAALEGMPDEGNPLEAWVQSKITKAKDYINSVSDYLLYNPDIKLGEDAKRVPRKPGQKAGSDKHSDLYTDENPRGTIHGLGFTDAATARKSVNKIKSSGKTHAHKIQAAIAMSQRAKVASERAKDPEKKKDLGSAHKVYQNYIDTNKKSKD